MNVNISLITISTGAVFALSCVSGSVFPRRLSAIHLPAYLLLPQQSPLELGGSDHPVGPTDPLAEGWIWHLQSGTFCLPHSGEIHATRYFSFLYEWYIYIQYIPIHYILLVFAGKDRGFDKPDHNAEVSLLDLFYFFLFRMCCLHIFNRTVYKVFMVCCMYWVHIYSEYVMINQSSLKLCDIFCVCHIAFWSKIVF